MKLLLFFGLFFSCAQHQKVADVTSVSLESKPEDKIVINDSTKADQELEFPKVREKSIALTMYSSLYHSLSLLEVLKNFEQKKIKVDIISSQGFGSLLAAIYAKDGSVGKMEWSLFKLVKNLHDKVPYSKSWREILDDFIDEEFKSLMLEDLKIQLLLPRINHVGLVSFEKNSSLGKLLKKQINLSVKDQYYKKPRIYDYLLKRYGRDLNVAISFMPEQPRLTRIVGYNYGLVTNHLGLVLSAKEEISILSTKTELPLDEIQSLADMTKEYNEAIMTFVDDVEDRLKIIQEDNSSGFQY